MPPPEPRAPQSETFIKVSLFSAVTKATKPLSYVQFDTGGTTDPQLHDIRKALSQKNAVNTKRYVWPRTTNVGSFGDQVADSGSLSVHLREPKLRTLSHIPNMQAYFSRTQPHQIKSRQTQKERARRRRIPKHLGQLCKSTCMKVHLRRPPVTKPRRS
jgi:hypothetical protein